MMSALQTFNPSDPDFTYAFRILSASTLNLAGRSLQGLSYTADVEEKLWEASY